MAHRSVLPREHVPTIIPTGVFSGTLAAIAVFAAAVSGFQVTAPVLVESNAGPVQGRRVGDVAEFRGTPFAMPPVAHLRWRAAQPHPAMALCRCMTAPSSRGLV